jgi:GR25 family glycosyltransferase involved in LPS biosynthesis
MASDDANSIQKFVVNLDRSALRLSAFQRRNSHISDINRFSAVDGTAIDRAELVASGVILEDCPYSPGTLGCALSHIAAWRMSIAEDRRLTIIEDDMLLRHDFAARYAQLLDRAPTDWEYVQWGYPYENCLVWMETPVGAARIGFFEPKQFEADHAFQTNMSDVSLFPVINTYGTMAYSISPAGATKFLEACLPLRQRDIDMYEAGVSYWDQGIDGPMNNAFRSMRAFVCFPPLAVHSPPDDAPSDRKDLDRN